jgi:hypothetical protein
MKQTALNKLTVEQLVQRFTAMALEQDQADLNDDVEKINRLFRQMESVKEELKIRTGDQRRALLRLYDHPNAQVRLKAAKATLAVAPQAARRALQLIVDAREHPQALDAGMTIRALDDGAFMPT